MRKSKKNKLKPLKVIPLRAKTATPLKPVTLSVQLYDITYKLGNPFSLVLQQDQND